MMVDYEGEYDVLLNNRNHFIRKRNGVRLTQWCANWISHR